MTLARNQIAPKLAKRILLIFEEATQLLLSLLDSPRVQAVCEYSEAAEAAEWTFRYAGSRLDITQSDDNLGLTLLKSMTERIEFDWNDGEAMPNVLRLTIKGI